MLKWIFLHLFGGIMVFLELDDTDCLLYVTVSISSNSCTGGTLLSDYIIKLNIVVVWSSYNAPTPEK